MMFMHEERFNPHSDELKVLVWAGKDEPNKGKIKATVTLHGNEVWESRFYSKAESALTAAMTYCMIINEEVLIGDKPVPHTVNELIH